MGIQWNSAGPQLNTLSVTGQSDDGRFVCVIMPIHIRYMWMVFDTDDHYTGDGPYTSPGGKPVGGVEKDFAEAKEAALNFVIWNTRGANP